MIVLHAKEISAFSTSILAFFANDWTTGNKENVASAGASSVNVYTI